jgi:glycine/D-amino acid oxidase-like deaminating enzyme
MADGAFYRSRSFWLETLGDPCAPRPGLTGDLQADVAIVGAGYTGLWTAYYLTELDPWLRVVVLEAEIAGFGASGRNGGWCSASLPTSLAKLAARHGRDDALALHHAMVDTVDEIGRVSDKEDIDCHFAKGGTLTLSTAPPQTDRIRAEIATEHDLGLTDADVRWLGPSEAHDVIAVEGLRGAAFSPHCAAVHPARLVRGLAEVVEEERNVKIFEQTPVLEIGPKVVRTVAGTVRAPVVVRATEGFTATIAGQRRTMAPLYSLMVATAPLPRHFWDAARWTERQTVTDGRHLIVYAQRTADGRIAMGGRGAPYHFASGVQPEFDRDDRVFASITKALGGWFPSLAGVEITHRWGGPLGVPRDWSASVGYDRESGLAWGGGYVGDGVAASNLAGRTLAHLVTGTDSPLVRLPWVDHRSRQWEPEPLRWFGINGGLRLTAAADAAEARSGRPARVLPWLRTRIMGR